MKLFMVISRELSSSFCFFRLLSPTPTANDFLRSHEPTMRNIDERATLSGNFNELQLISLAPPLEPFVPSSNFGARKINLNCSLKLEMKVNSRGQEIRKKSLEGVRKKNYVLDGNLESLRRLFKHRTRNPLRHTYGEVFQVRPLDDVCLMRKRRLKSKILSLMRSSTSVFMDLIRKRLRV